MKKSILYVNSCVRKESRTGKLAGKLLSKLNRPYEEIRLEEIDFPVTDEDFLNMRDQFISEGDFGNPVYVTTAGGFYVPEEYGFGYVKALAENYYGIRDVRKIEAVGLDIYGADVNAIMAAAEDALSIV